jgi:hypothetical protein
LSGSSVVVIGGMSGNCGQTLLRDASTFGNTSQSKKGPRTPSATRAANGSQARGLRGLPELFATIEVVCIAVTCTRANPLSEPQRTGISVIAPL